jgi:hypothetical protein
MCTRYIFPDTLLIIFAMIVLLITSTVTLIKGINLHHKESVKLHQEEAALHSSDLNPLLSHHSSSTTGSKVVLDHPPSEPISSSSDAEPESLPIYPDGNEDGIGGGEGAGMNGLDADDVTGGGNTPMVTELPSDADTSLKIPYIPILVVFLSWLVSYFSFASRIHGLSNRCLIDLCTFLRDYERCDDLFGTILHILCISLSNSCDRNYLGIFLYQINSRFTIRTTSSSGSHP